MPILSGKCEATSLQQQLAQSKAITRSRRRKKGEERRRKEKKGEWEKKKKKKEQRIRDVHCLRCHLNHFLCYERLPDCTEVSPPPHHSQGVVARIPTSDWTRKVSPVKPAIFVRLVFLFKERLFRACVVIMSHRNVRKSAMKWR